MEFSLSISSGKGEVILTDDDKYVSNDIDRTLGTLPRSHERIPNLVFVGQLAKFSTTHRI